MGSMAILLLAAFVLFDQFIQPLQFAGIELLTLDQAHEQALHRPAKQAVNHVASGVTRGSILRKHGPIFEGLTS